MVSTKSYVRDGQVITSLELAQNLEQQTGAPAPAKFSDGIKAGFRQGYREHATSTAEKTLSAGTSATVTILQMAAWIQEMRSRLSRKEFSAFVKELLQWVGDEARKYLDIARTFKDFDLTRLQKLEPFTLLKLRSKRYLPVVENLREESDITPKLVQNLIRELLPKQSRKKPDEPISDWKQSRSGGTRYYNVVLHDEVTGLSIEQQAEAENILPQRVIAEAVALRLQHKSSPVQINEYYAAQLEELHSVVEHARSLDTEKRRLELELQKRDRTIAQLEAKLAFRTAACSVEPDNAQEYACKGSFENPLSLELEIEDQVTIASLLNEYPEEQVSAIASVRISECEFSTNEATNDLELEQEYSDLEPVEKNAQNLEPKPQVFQEGDRVEIVSDRQGSEFVWQIGVAKVANTVGCVVEVLGKTLWFCIDEIVLVSAAIQT